MDLQLRNSIYQCNPRCSIEKRNTKNHSAAATPATTATTNANGNANANVTPATVSAMPTFMTTSSRDRERDRPFRPHDYTSSLLNKIERDCTDKHELHRNNCLNEMVSELLYLWWRIYIFYKSRGKNSGTVFLQQRSLCKICVGVGVDWEGWFLCQK